MLSATDLTHFRRELSAFGKASGQSGKMPRGKPKPGRQIFEAVEVDLMAMVEYPYGREILYTGFESLC